MPRQVVRAPEHNQVRSLGWLAIAWLEYLTVHGRGDNQGDPVILGNEYKLFTVDCYALKAKSGRRLYDSAFLSRPKGADKSGRGAGFALFEALGPCRFAGWAKGGEVYTDPWGLGFEYTYEKGEPMGRPIHAPLIRCMATEEGQTGNVYDSIYYNLTDSDSPLSLIPGLDAGLTRTRLPNGGEIRPCTAGNASKDGGLETFAVFDETHLYVLPELRGMYGTVTRNLRKRKKTAQTWYLETTTMFAPGEDSVAEGTYELAALIEQGETKRQNLLYDHSWGDCEDLTDEPALRAAITDAFGDAIEWNDLDGLVDEFYDPRKLTPDSRRFFLNSRTQPADAFIEEYQWEARLNLERPILPNEPVVIGFDGSRKRARGMTDATALVGCTVRDGHLFEIEIWEQQKDEKNWEVPVTLVDSRVREAFRQYNVVGFFADPAKWESYVAKWEAEFSRKLKVKATQSHPIQRWMTGGKASQTVKSIEVFHSAIIENEMSHRGDSRLSAHMLNAHNRTSRYGLQIAKEHPDSHRKIDGAVAAVLAWECRIAALAGGFGQNNQFVPRRIR